MNAFGAKPHKLTFDCNLSFWSIRRCLCTFVAQTYHYYYSLFQVQILCDGTELISPVQVEVQPAPLVHQQQQEEEEEDPIDVVSESSQTMSAIPDYYDPPSIGHVSFSGNFKWKSF